MTRPFGVTLEVSLGGLRAVGIGAGEVAWRKYSRLLDAEAALTVVAPEAASGVRRAADHGLLVWHQRAYEPGDLDGAALVVAATSADDVNRRVAEDAATAGTLCVRVDGGGSAALAATVRRGPLSIAVSTGGRAPGLARRLREEIGERYGDEFGELAMLLGELRADPAVREALAGLPASERAARWRAASGPDILSLIRTGRPDLAKEAALACLSSSSD